jgi:pyridoxal phosphate enzyme (YggS family)
MSSISTNINAVQERLAKALQKAGRGAGDARLLAISKTFPIETIQEAYAVGLRHFGENRVQELCAKAPHLPQDCQWHLVGHLQRNKVRAALEQAAWLHAIDSLALAQRIQRIAEEEGKSPKLLLEVNVSGEESKFGLAPDAVEPVLAALQGGPGTCCGLMTVAPLHASEQELHAVFAGLRNLRDQLALRTGAPLPELSMGMSGDMEIAVAEGATIVRIGTAIFGQR